MPDSAPPNFYQNVAAMSGGGSASAKTSPAGAAGGKSPDQEMLDGISQIYRVMVKMEKAASKIGKPELRQKFEPMREMLKQVVVDVFKTDPSKVFPADESTEGTVPGNKSPQGVPEPTPPPPDQAQPVPA